MRIPPAAAGRQGAFTVDDLRAAGITRESLRHALRRGLVRRLYRGVYASAVAAQRDRCWFFGAVLTADGRAAVCRRTAAVVHQLPVEDVARAADGFPVVHVVLTGRRQIRPCDHRVVHRPRALSVADLTERRGLPTTTLERTVLDLGAELPADELVNLVAHVVQHGRTTSKRLSEATARAGRTPGARQLHEVLRTLSDGHQSAFEVALARLIGRSQLPVAKYGVTLVTSSGERRPDAYWPEAAVALEADGKAFHLGPDAWEADLERDDDLAAIGVEAVHVTFRQFTREPAEVLARIERVLRRRWPTGEPPIG